jgi:hypothetical protein
LQLVDRERSSDLRPDKPAADDYGRLAGNRLASDPLKVVEAAVVANSFEVATRDREHTRHAARCQEQLLKSVAISVAVDDCPLLRIQGDRPPAQDKLHSVLIIIGAGLDEDILHRHFPKPEFFGKRWTIVGQMRL